MSNEYQFTQDWFSWSPPVWEQLTPMLPERKKFLEIGSFEGRSMVWIAENMAGVGAEIFCIDTWDGGEEHSNGEMAGAEVRFDYNRELVCAKKAVKINKIKCASAPHLATMITANMLNASVDNPTELFDFIYIDGSHTAPDVLTDACMAWQLLKPEGIMVFDDYAWGNPRDVLHRPKMAIDAFTNIFAEQCDIVHMGYQAVVRKK